MERSMWLMSFLFAGEQKPMDTIRIMKGLFIVGQESPKPLPSYYEFEPYLYGPCSFEVYGDLDELLKAGLVEEHRPYYRSYCLTAKGTEKAKNAWSQIAADIRLRIETTKELVLSKSFSELLEYVYTKWPKMASMSIFSPIRR